jgi:hypothetical protein
MLCCAVYSLPLPTYLHTYIPQCAYTCLSTHPPSYTLAGSLARSLDGLGRAVGEAKGSWLHSHAGSSHSLPCSFISLTQQGRSS